MAPPTVIPPKPLLCYPIPDYPWDGQLHSPPAEACTVDSVLAIYKAEAAAFTQRCDQNSPAYVPPVSIGVDEIVKILRSESRPVHPCVAARYQFSVYADRLGALGNSPFARLIPFLDLAGIDDFRSGDVLDQIGRDPDLARFMATKKTITILYPASGSHMAPLAIPFAAIDRGQLNSATLIYTEYNEGGFNRHAPKIWEYLKFMDREGMISDLKREMGTFWFSPGDETRFTFTYKGKPIRLEFDFNRGGELWARDSRIAKADLFIFHDGVFNDLVEKNGKPRNMIADRFMQHLATLTEKDGRARFVATENQWKKDCDNGTTCTVNGHTYPARTFEGFYGCSLHHYFGFAGKYYRDVGGKLFADPKSIMRSIGIHVPPSTDKNPKEARLLVIQK